MKTRLIIFLLLTSVIGFINAQEVLSGLQFNEAVKQQHKVFLANKTLKQDVNEQSLHLPFFEDFATSKVYPDNNLWIDRDVFINSDFPHRPTNIGVATFDALDETGAVYPNAEWIAFEADVLTSQPIRLDSAFTPVTKKLSPQDSVYLSFYYQPQGKGNAPEAWDTLILEINRPTGDTVFAYYDSIVVNIEYYLENENDTVFPGDTLWAPPGCNPNMYLINYSTLTIADQWVTVLCDSVMEPEYQWDEVWSAEGMTLEEFNTMHGKDFVQVMIPILDEKYFHHDFSFRFRNYASIANDEVPSWKSNVDQWNVDFIYLNHDRTAGDTTYRKLVFSERAPSFLKRYEVMPYKQFKADAPQNTMKEELNMYMANLDKVGHNTKYMYKFQQEGGAGYSTQYLGGSCNLPPFYSYGFQNCEISCGAAHACPPVYPFNSDYNSDTASYLIKHYVSDSSEANILVDSAIYHQGFYNYYAYDDGTPEFGWGLNYSGAKLGYQFKLSVPDTIYGVQMYFNKTLNDENVKYFDLLVYRDNNGEPGEIIARQEGVKPKWNDGLFNFYTYLFDEPVLLSGTFYVGWEQFDIASLSIGFDTHLNSQTSIFYTVGDVWYQSIHEGSLMIRPIIGSIGGELIFSTSESDETERGLQIYPNPTTNSFRIDLSNIDNPSNAAIEIFSLYGSRVYQRNGIGGVIDVNNLAKGIYIVKVADGNRFYTSKLIVK